MLQLLNLSFYFYFFSLNPFKCYGAFAYDIGKSKFKRDNWWYLLVKIKVRIRIKYVGPYVFEIETWFEGFEIKFSFLELFILLYLIFLISFLSQ